MEHKAKQVFEVSWEVCNKVGGINTVVVSKALSMIAHYKQGYYTIGPYQGKQSLSGIFEEKESPELLREIFEKLVVRGIRCYYGKWLVNGEPQTILIDFRGFQNQGNQIKGALWQNFGIDSLNSAFHDFDEPVIWATAVGMLLEEIREHVDGPIVAHCHEWLSGAALLYIKLHKVRIGTVFTTHATMLGRTLAGNNRDLYNSLTKFNPLEEAYRYGIQAKFLMEKACAEHTDVFTTVSEITGIEATYFLGKKPHLLLPNGLNIERFPTFDEASVKHKLYKKKIKQFLMYHFFPYYAIDLDNTLIYFLSGRFEMRDKGIDLFIKSLARLSNMLKKGEKNIVAFILVPFQTKGINPRLLENKTYFEDVQESILDVYNDIQERLVYGILSGKKIDEPFLLGEELQKELKRKVMRFQKEGIPPISTHLFYEDNEIMRALRENNLLNKEEDKVKVIYYPIYLTGADQLMDLNYYETIMGSHLGIFPSYYEPWGYTPAETGALGVASVTTDLAGFGRYIQKNTRGKKDQGIFVVNRLNRSDEEVIEELADIMHKFSSFSKLDRIANKLRAKKLASMADWKLLVENYIKAHNQAIERLEQQV